MHSHTTTTAPHSPACTPPPLTVTAWRDYDPDVCALPDMALGAFELTGPTDRESDRLWERGARRVHLPDPVDLTASGPRALHTVRSLCLIRDLTARAVCVQWEMRWAGTPLDGAWRALGHLQPPTRLTGSTPSMTIRQQWCEEHYLCKCVWRKGPGFLQIRDRRWGELRRFTVAEPAYRDAIALLVHGAHDTAVPAPVLADFRAERLVHQVGEWAWWLPYRVNRWAQESTGM